MRIPNVSFLQNVFVCLLILITISKASTVCPVQKGILFYPDPVDCRAYTYCLQGVIRPGSCTDNLYFNSVSKRCDVPANVHCPPGSKQFAAAAAAKPKPPALTTPKPIIVTAAPKPITYTNTAPQPITTNTAPQPTTTTTTTTPQPTTTTTEPQPTTTTTAAKPSCNCNTSPLPPSNGNSPAENPTPNPPPPETTTQNPALGNPISSPPSPPPPLPPPPPFMSPPEPPIMGPPEPPPPIMSPSEPPPASMSPPEPPPPIMNPPEPPPPIMNPPEPPPIMNPPEPPPPIMSPTEPPPPIMNPPEPPPIMNPPEPPPPIMSPTEPPPPIMNPPEPPPPIMSPPEPPPPIMSPPEPPAITSPPPETTDSDPPENPPTGVTSNPMESTTETNIETTPAEVTKPPITVRSLPGKYPHEFSCMNEPCGIYPNINDCSQYIICIEGKETIKHCNDGQLFDTRTLECQSAEKAQCWQEPACEPSRQRPEPRRACPFHNKTPMPYVPLQNGILTSPIVTNWGNWEGWKYCPPNTYVNGIYVWRQLVQRGTIIDQAGIASISLNCATINGDVVTNIESNAPGAPAESWPTHYTCVGTGIGFRANSQPDQGSGDDLATDNVQVLCSCGLPVYKRYDLQTGIQSGDRGTWTDPQVCLPKQAICGMQTQMVPFTQDGSNDNTGLNNFQMKCCDVPDPTDSCIPTEEMRLVRKCSNLEGKFHRRSDFAISIGLAYDTSVHYNTLNFYGSIGYALNDTRDVLMTKFADLATQNLNLTHEYHWDSPHETILENEKTTERFIYVNVNTTTELYQIVGKCSPYEIRTNWLVQIDTDVNTGAVNKTYYEV